MQKNQSCASCRSTKCLITNKYSRTVSVHLVCMTCNMIIFFCISTRSLFPLKKAHLTLIEGTNDPRYHPCYPALFSARSLLREYSSKVQFQLALMLVSTNHKLS